MAEQLGVPRPASIDEAMVLQFDEALRERGGAIRAVLADYEIEAVPPDLHVLWEHIEMGVRYLRVLEREVDQRMGPYRYRWERERQYGARYEFDVKVDDRIRPGMLVMTSANVGALDLETGETAAVEPDDDDGQRYGEAVNAPLSDATIAALNKALTSGDYPRYKRRRRDEPQGDGDA